MPWPSSRTSTRTPPSAARSVRVIVLPRGENLAALPIRFQITCCTRPLSASSGVASSRRSSASRWPLSSSVCWTTATASRSTAPASTRSRASGSLPMLRRDMSRMSVIIRAWIDTLRSIAASPLTSSSGGLCRCSTCVQPMIAFSGVRSSCDSTAIRSSFMRESRSASPRATRSRSSSSWRCRASSWRCEMSEAIAMQMPGSIGGEAVHSTGTARPPLERSGNSARAPSLPSIAMKPRAAPWSSLATKSVSGRPTTASLWSAPSSSSASIAGLASSSVPSPARSRQMPIGACA